jgi:hypothetical protein
MSVYPPAAGSAWDVREMTDLVGKTVLITAAAQGIGLASAQVRPCAAWKPMGSPRLIVLFGKRPS